MGPTTQASMRRDVPYGPTMDSEKPDCCLRNYSQSIAARPHSFSFFSDLLSVKDSRLIPTFAAIIIHFSPLCFLSQILQMCWSNTQFTNDMHSFFLFLSMVWAVLGATVWSYIYATTLILRAHHAHLLQFQDADTSSPFFSKKIKWKKCLIWKTEATLTTNFHCLAEWSDPV